VCGVYGSTAYYVQPFFGCKYVLHSNFGLVVCGQPKSCFSIGFFNTELNGSEFSVPVGFSVAFAELPDQLSTRIANIHTQDGKLIYLISFELNHL